MNPIQFVLLAFIIVPFIEIYFLLKIGSIVGVFPTILLVVLTAVIGVSLLKKQGMQTWMKFQDSLQRGQIPAYEMVEGALLLLGGALLLTPGFFTDIIGFAILVPALRKKMAKFIIEQRLLQPVGRPQNNSTEGPNVIEGEYKKDD